ncbi:HEAT repeat domain-containing protein [Myxococcus virescens]|uniref:HEAT repeat domain-containing protein n=1 Tax=Myxococcus virescens TaxID=83456 RepID=UPI003DA44F81
MSSPLSTWELLHWVATKPTRSTREDLDALLARADFTQVARDVLVSGTTSEKTTALRVLRELTSPEAHALARLALRDAAADVRALAARALVSAQDAADWRSLQEALDDTAPSVQHAAMDSLARMNPVAASDLFLERFERAPEAEKLNALATAQRLGLPESGALARLGLASASSTIRAAAVDLVAREGEATEGLLIHLLTDASENVQLHALRTLTYRAHVPASVFVPLLAASSSPPVRAQALQALILRRDASTCEPVCRLLTDPDASLRRRAILATERLGCTSATPTLLEMLARTRDEDERADLVAALGGLGGPEAWEALRQALSDESPRVRRAAIIAWASDVAPPDATTVLLERLRGAPDTETRKAVALALMNCRPEVAHRALRLALEDSVPEVRRMAVRALGLKASPEALQTLRDHQATERDPDVLRHLDAALERRQAPGDTPIWAASPAERLLFDPARTEQSVAQWIAVPERYPATERFYFYEGGHLERQGTDGRVDAFQYTAIEDQLRVHPQGAPERSTAFTVTPAAPPHRFRLELAQDVLTGTEAPRTLHFIEPRQADTEPVDGD